MANEFLNIVDYIPLGRENAVSRHQLCLVTGLDDRTMRLAIEHARAKYPICNDQDGRGYYIPRLGNYDDMKATEAWIKQTKSRAEEIYASTKGAIKFLEKAGVM